MGLKKAGSLPGKRYGGHRRLQPTHHREEDAELRVEGDRVAVREDELRLALLLRAQHDRDLLSGDGQHRQLDAVKLVETSPRARLRQACNDARRHHRYCSRDTYRAIIF